jgi:hypothetical protein
MSEAIGVEREGTKIWVEVKPNGRAFIKTHYKANKATGCQHIEGQELVGEWLDKIKQQGNKLTEKQVGRFIAGRPYIESTYQLDGVVFTISEGLAFYKIKSNVGTKEDVLKVFHKLSS